MRRRQDEDNFTALHGRDKLATILPRLERTKSSKAAATPETRGA